MQANHKRRKTIDAPLKKTDKVAIVGFTDSRLLAPFGHPDWEIWGINELYRYHDARQFSRWFEVHNRKLIEEDPGMPPNWPPHIQALKQFPIPVYMQEKYDDIPPSIEFPKAAIEEVLPEGRYQTSSISWLIALAIAEGFDTIGVYGVDMAQECLAPGTRVLTADLRWVDVADVEVGDDLLGFDEHTGPNNDGPHAYRQWRVSKLLSKSTKPLPSYRIHFEDGTTIVASDSHPWLTYGEHEMRWKRTDELVTPAHRHPTKVVKLLDVWDEDRSWEAGYLASAFDGEGWIRQNKHNHCNGNMFSLGFSQAENAMADEVRIALAIKGFDWSEARKEPGNSGNLAVQTLLQYHIKGGRPELLRFLGQIRPRRLLDQFDPNIIGNMQRKEAVAVTKLEYLGKVETVGFTTSTQTLVAEGFATHNTEYAEQRPACEYWIGVARGLGIEVILPDTSDLLKSVGQYGFGDGSLFRRKLTERKEWLEQEAKRHEQILGQHDAKAKAERERIISSLQQIHGALQDVIYWRRSWSIAGDGSPTKPFTDRQPDKQVTVKAINQPDWVPEATPEEAVQEAKVPDG